MSTVLIAVIAAAGLGIAWAGFRITRLAARIRDERIAELTRKGRTEAEIRRDWPPAPTDRPE